MSELSEIVRQQPCSLCGGDCSAANPPVMFCPKQQDAEVATALDAAEKALEPFKRAFSQVPEDVSLGSEIRGLLVCREITVQNLSDAAAALSLLRAAPPKEPTS